MGLHENMQTEPVSRLTLRPSVNIEPTTKVRDAVLARARRDWGVPLL